MFVYALRIFDRFRQPAISVAILCDGNAAWRPNRYEFSYPGTHLSFQFDTIKLLDYQAQWESLAANHNPFATVVMAHLKAQETKRRPTDRKEWKLSLIRHWAHPAVGGLEKGLARIEEDTKKVRLSKRTPNNKILPLC